MATFYSVPQTPTAFGKIRAALNTDGDTSNPVALSGTALYSPLTRGDAIYYVLAHATIDDLTAGTAATVYDTYGNAYTTQNLSDYIGSSGICILACRGYTDTKLTRNITVGYWALSGSSYSISANIPSDSSTRVAWITTSEFGYFTIAGDTSGVTIAFNQPDADNPTFTGAVTVDMYFLPFTTANIVTPS